MRIVHAVLFVGMLMAAMFPAAGVPDGTVFLEGETFKCLKKSRVRSLARGEYVGFPSGGKMMYTYNGRFAAELKKPLSGKYRAWFRLVYPRQNFLFIFAAGGKKFSFDPSSQWRKEKRCSFVWGCAEVDFTPDDGQLEFHHVKGNCLAVDCVVLVPAEKNYLPVIRDFAVPVYVRFKSRDRRPLYFSLFGRLPRAPWVIGHWIFSEKECFKGELPGSRAFAVSPGGKTDWICLSHLLDTMGWNTLQFTAWDSRKTKPSACAFDLEFSSAPAEQGIYGRLSRKGPGHGLRCKLDVSARKVMDPVEESHSNLKKAQAVGEMPGKAPVKFPIGTGISVSSGFDVPEIWKNELAVMNALGVNMLRGDPAFAESNTQIRFLFSSHTISYLAAKPKCPAGFRKNADSALKKIAGGIKYPEKQVFFGLWDEPSFPVSHLLKCKDCQRGFADFLKRNQVTLSVPEVSGNMEQPERYYWTMRYCSELAGSFFRRAKQGMQEVRPGLPVGFNIANEVLSNMLKDGFNWFELVEKGDVSMLWSEDWLNQQTSFQLCGYIAALLRAAAGEKIPFGMYNILARFPWEIEAKAFSEIGQGVKVLYFFNYGPHYAAHADFNSDRKELYPVVKRIAYSVGAFEDILLKARPERGDVAVLYSSVGDIWNLTPKNQRATERAFLYLLLRHSGYRVDFLHENELPAKLDSYQVLFAVDSHVRKEHADLIRKWAGEKKHRLILYPDAVSRDELNRKLTWILPRGEYRENPNERYHPRRQGQLKK